MFVKFIILFTLFIVSKAMSNATHDLISQLSDDEFDKLFEWMQKEQAIRSTKKQAFVPFQLKPKLYNQNIAELDSALSQVDIGVVGLHNGKKICFIIAVMQCLAHIPQLYHFLSGNQLSTTFLEDFNDMSSQLTLYEARQSPIVQFVQLLDSMYRAPLFGELFEPTYHFADMVQRHNDLLSKDFPPNVQQDAHEFLLQLLSLVSMPLRNNVTVWPNPSLFSVETYDYSTQIDDATQILNGSEVYSQSQMLQLTIPHELYQQRKTNAMYGTVSIYDCLQDAKFEVVRPDESKPNLVVRHRLITKTPEILIIHLQRTGYNANGYHKINTNVEYPLLLDISQFTSNVTQSNEYQLIGVVNHIGHDMRSGHYTAYAKAITSDTWHFYDDNRVEVVQNIDKVLKNQNAYILFYKKSTVKLPRVHGTQTQSQTTFNSNTADRTFMSTALFNSNNEIMFNHWSTILRGFDGNVKRMEKALAVDRYITKVIKPNFDELKNVNLGHLQPSTRSDVKTIIDNRLTTYGIARQFGKWAFVEFLNKRLPSNETFSQY